ncbi:MAG: GTP cyclohydrolase I FolE [Clostridia bacterium]|nr:GTP cyclohydrolase I FolE [Clostridia bacterium]
MIDNEKIKAATRLFLEGIGEDTEREGLAATPDRVARMCDELFGGYDNIPDEHLSCVFGSDAGGMVVERKIRFYSVCEHHLLPFFGHITIAYVPDGRVVGLSKLARTVEVYARRLQIQENMTNQIAGAVFDILKPKGVMVIAEAEHMCMSMRGVKQGDSKTLTYAVRGCFDGDTELQNRAFALHSSV